jgi:CheY-like chemotaxis protein
LDIAEGLKQLLIDADVTIDSIISLSYRELSEMLNIDLYVSELIVEVVQKVIQERNFSQVNYNGKTPDKKTIMICDDEPDVLKLFGQALRSKYNVILVSSGEDCIDKFIKEKDQANKVHLILLDYKLGDMMGDSIARTLKELNGTKIILITAYEVDNELLEELEENKYIARYIEKPIHLDKLIELVANTIN